MEIAFFSTKSYEREAFDRQNTLSTHTIRYIDTHLSADTASLAGAAPAVCAFVNDRLDRTVLTKLAAQGCRLIALRSAGFNHVDLVAASELGMRVVRVPAYSPHAIAEHTLALILALNRKIPKAYNRVREGNFSLEGLTGFDLCGKQVGVIGTGLIGAVVCRILLGFGCRVRASDPKPSDELVNLGVVYQDVDTLLRESDIVTLHCPLMPATRHLINAERLKTMKPGVMLINTGRGALVDTPSVVQALKSRQIGHLGLDVYEEEAALFFEDCSDRIIGDDVFMRLLTFPNVIVTGHQAFLTEEALGQIASTTLNSVRAFAAGAPLVNAV